jgi:hypothetical protein
MAQLIRKRASASRASALMLPHGSRVELLVDRPPA